MVSGSKVVTRGVSQACELILQFLSEDPLRLELMVHEGNLVNEKLE